MQMVNPLVEDLVCLENGLRMFDAYCNSMVYVIAPVLCALCDNVRASELLQHLGSKGKKLCRFCMVSRLEKLPKYVHRCLYFMSLYIG